VRRRPSTLPTRRARISGRVRLVGFVLRQSSPAEQPADKASSVAVASGSSGARRALLPSRARGPVAQMVRAADS
jgi:hypothetical protein